MHFANTFNVKKYLNFQKRIYQFVNYSIEKKLTFQWSPCFYKPLVVKKMDRLMPTGGSFLLNRFLFSMCVKFFIIICAGCVGGNGQNFGLDDSLYNTTSLLSFDRVGTYSTGSFVLSFSQSSVFDGLLSERNEEIFSFSRVLLSGYVESAIIEFLNLRYERAYGYRMEYTANDPYSRTGTVRASGLVIAPSTSRPLPLLVYFHPTLLHKDSAPSLMPLSLLSVDPVEDYRLMMIFLALQGYIVFAPDYVGYGSSEDRRHPYLYKKAVVQTTASMLHSTVDALNKEKIPFERDLFIVGYSQGGHGALAFAEALQNSFMDFEVQAVSAGGGPYDMLYTVREYLDRKTISRNLMTLLLQSYSYIYNWDMNDIVKKETYAESISSFFRYDSLSRATEELPNRTSTLFRPQFIRDIYGKEAKGNNPFQIALEENSVYDWSPKTPVFLFHSKEDQIVPYRNMEIAYRSFGARRAGVKKKDCSFKKVEDLLDIAEELNKGRPLEPDHVNCNFIFFLETGDYLLDYRN